MANIKISFSLTKSYEKGDIFERKVVKRFMSSKDNTPTPQKNSSRPSSFGPEERRRFEESILNSYPGSDLPPEVQERLRQKYPHIGVGLDKTKK